MKKIDVSKNVVEIELNFGAYSEVLHISATSTATYEAISQGYQEMLEIEKDREKIPSITDEVLRGQMMMTIMVRQGEVIKKAIKKVVPKKDWELIADKIDFIPYKALTAIYKAISEAVGTGFVDAFQEGKV